MSRYYQMEFSIKEFDKNRRDEIVEAIEEIWSIDSVGPGNDYHIWMSGEGHLCGGESEDEFSERAAREIWIANKGYCDVEITATYLEELPYDTHKPDYLLYASLLQSNDEEFLDAIKPLDVKCEYCGWKKETKDETCKNCGS